METDSKQQGLTGRQAVVAELVRSGLTSKQVADKLSVSVPTIDRDRAIINMVVEDSEIVQQARVDVLNLAPAAVDRYKHSLETTDRDSYSVAKDVLRTAGAIRERVEIEHNHQVHTAEEFNDRFSNALRLAGQRPEEAEVIEDDDAEE